jgi:hypothetical protein
MRIAIAAFAALTTAACAAAPQRATPEMYYNCDVHLTNEYGRFIAKPHQLRWYTTLPGDVHIGLTYFVWLKPGPNEAVRMFGGLGADHANLYLEWRDRRWRDLPPHGEEVRRTAEARIGEAAIQAVYTRAPAGHFTTAEVGALLSNEGTLELTLTDEAGAELQRVEVSRAYLIEVERHLRETAAQVLENVADEEHRCRLEPVEEIIVVH